jgi:hypothetical protein
MTEIKNDSVETCLTHILWSTAICKLFGTGHTACGNPSLFVGVTWAKAANLFQIKDETMSPVQFANN